MRQIAPFNWEKFSKIPHLQITEFLFNSVDFSLEQDTFLNEANEQMKSCVIDKDKETTAYATPGLSFLDSGYAQKGSRSVSFQQMGTAQYKQQSQGASSSFGTWDKSFLTPAVVKTPYTASYSESIPQKPNYEQFGAFNLAGFKCNRKKAITKYTNISTRKKHGVT
ncbi:unnamed protein product [Mytilus coruscus]|uniref:Uncharacterized protein n=1 Tax=Mytilus coruscus TaxID=42192 RepID=A0A6J8EGF8_MYTCO|nr:unnamed protein product [Mytilus coruscus]